MKLKLVNETEGLRQALALIYGENVGTSLRTQARKPITMTADPVDNPATGGSTIPSNPRHRKFFGMRDNGLRLI